jgi:hypothetical protein
MTTSSSIEAMSAQRILTELAALLGQARSTRKARAAPDRALDHQGSAGSIEHRAC